MDGEQRLEGQDTGRSRARAPKRALRRAFARARRGDRRGRSTPPLARGPSLALRPRAGVGGLRALRLVRELLRVEHVENNSPASALALPRHRRKLDTASPLLSAQGRTLHRVRDTRAPCGARSAHVGARVAQALLVARVVRVRRGGGARGRVPPKPPAFAHGHHLRQPSRYDGRRGCARLPSSLARRSTKRTPVVNAPFNVEAEVLDTPRDGEYIQTRSENPFSHTRKRIRDDGARRRRKARLRLYV